MIKYFIFALFIAIAIFAIWFSQWTGPQKLNFADRVYWNGTHSKYTVETGIAFGTDERQKLNVYTPVTKAGSSAQRVMIFFHGGTWSSGDSASYAFVGRAFAAKGFVTIVADYRKSPAHRFPTFVQDAADVITWAYHKITAYHGDPAQIYVMGHSAGAHIAMLAALDPQYLARCDMDSSAIKGIIGLAGPYDFLPFTGDATKTALGQWPQLSQTQPINYVRRDAPPMLLLTGDKDTTVLPRNTTALATAIKAAGGKASVKIYSGVDHTGIVMALSNPFRNRAPVVDDVLRFTHQ